MPYFITSNIEMTLFRSQTVCLAIVFDAVFLRVPYLQNSLPEGCMRYTGLLKVEYDIGNGARPSASGLAQTATVAG